LGYVYTRKKISTKNVNFAFEKLLFKISSFSSKNQHAFLVVFF
jgi:hypothetical protein